MVSPRSRTRKITRPEDCGKVGRRGYRSEDYEVKDHKQFYWNRYYVDPDFTKKIGHYEEPDLTKKKGYYGSEDHSEAKDYIDYAPMK